MVTHSFDAQSLAQAQGVPSAADPVPRHVCPVDAVEAPPELDEADGGGKLASIAAPPAQRGSG
jgi:hypothetical protein